MTGEATASWIFMKGSEQRKQGSRGRVATQAADLAAQRSVHSGPITQAARGSMRRRRQGQHGSGWAGGRPVGFE